MGVTASVQRQDLQVGREGTEQPSDHTEKSEVVVTSGAPTGARGDGGDDAWLRLVIEAWPKLSDEQRREIVAVIKA